VPPARSEPQNLVKLLSSANTAVMARLDEDRGDGRGSQRNLSLALDLRRCGLIGSVGSRDLLRVAFHAGGQIVSCR
jgi:hypothetical protein